jgi:hypothetical protein
LILKRGIISNLWKNHKTHLAYRTPKVAREREGRTNLEIGSGLLLKFQSNEKCSKTNLIESMAPVMTPRTLVFLLYRTITTGIILRVSTTRPVQEEQDENVW